MQEMQVRSLGWKNPLEKIEMATYSSILTWIIPWTEDPGGIEVQLIYIVVPISGLVTAKRLIFTHMYILSFNILFHYDLSQEIGYSSLCYTVGLCCLSILNIIVYIYQLQIPSPLSLFPCSLLAATSLIFISAPQSKFRTSLFSLKETPMPVGGDSPFHTPPPSPKLLLIYFLSQQICVFWKFHMDGLKQYVVCYNWLLLLTHILACIITSFLFIAD